jgi:transcription initiation factor TFIIIB Brf1 subunit/transcription initiation factor TFIIB
MDNTFFGGFIDDDSIISGHHPTQASDLSEHALRKFTGPLPARKTNFCADCNSEMEPEPLPEGVMIFVCQSCGKQGSIAEQARFTDNSEYNASNSNVAIISGSSDPRFSKKLISGKQEYSETRRKTTMSDIEKCIWQHVGAGFPRDVVNHAYYLISQVQSKQINRSDVRLGIFAACLHKACVDKETPRHASEIAAMFGIGLEMMSQGYKIIKKLVNDGVVKVSQSPHHFSGYNQSVIVSGLVNSHFEQLEIPEKYKQFTFDLIRFTQVFRISDSSNDNSKCSGVIFILNRRCKDVDVSPEQIEEKCKISKNTFHEFAKVVEAVLTTNDRRYAKMQKKLRHLYKKHGVPL